MFTKGLAYLGWIRKIFTGFHTNNNYYIFFILFPSEGDDVTCLYYLQWRLNNVFYVLRVVIDPADNNKIFDPSTDKELTILQETNIAGAEIAIAVPGVVLNGVVKDLMGELRAIPVALTFALTR